MGTIQGDGVRLVEALTVIVRAWRLLVPAVILAAFVGWIVADNVPKLYQASVAVRLTVPELLAVQSASGRDDSAKSGNRAPSDIGGQNLFGMSAQDGDESTIWTFAPSPTQAQRELEGAIASLRLAYPSGGAQAGVLRRKIAAMELSIANLRATEAELRASERASPTTGGPVVNIGGQASLLPHVDALIVLDDALQSRSDRLLDLQSELRLFGFGIVASPIEVKLESGADPTFSAAVCAAIAAVLAANIALFRGAWGQRKSERTA